MNPVHARMVEWPEEVGDCCADLCNNLCALIEKVVTLVVEFFEFICCCECCDEEDEPFIAVEKPAWAAWERPPISSFTPADWEIQLRPISSFKVDERVEVVYECPVAPMRLADQAGDKSDIHREIRTAISKDAEWQDSDSDYMEINVPVSYKGGVLKIQKNCNRLTQEHWIELLNEIPVSAAETPIVHLRYRYDGCDGLDLQERDIKRELRKDREIVMKQRLAVLAELWVDAKMVGGRQRTNETAHPFNEIYKNKECPAAYYLAGDTLTAIQEISRFLPLIKAFSAQQKQILVRHPKIEDKKISVNYLCDSVLSISTKLSGLIIHNGQGPTAFKNKGGRQTTKVWFKELTSDKIVYGANLVWSAYQKAKANGELPEYFYSLNQGLCFDGRMTEIGNYVSKFSNHPDFILNGNEIKKGNTERYAEYYQKFIYEQCAVYCERQETKIDYSTFREKITQRTEETQSDPQIVEFFKLYATKERFKGWLKEIAMANPFLPRISTVLTYCGEKSEFDQAIDTLEQVLMMTFDP